MRKIAVILLFILYLTPTFGVNITVHYCGGEFSSLTFGTTAKNKCACGSKKMKKNCCKDKIFSFQVHDDQLKTKVVNISIPKIFNFQVVLPKDFQFNYQYFPLFTQEGNFQHLPNNEKPPLYILNQVFLI